MKNSQFYWAKYWEILEYVNTAEAAEIKLYEYI